MGLFERVDIDAVLLLLLTGLLLWFLCVEQVLPASLPVLLQLPPTILGGVVRDRLKPGDKLALAKYALDRYVRTHLLVGRCPPCHCVANHSS